MIKTELRILQDSRTSYKIHDILFSSEATIQALYHQAQELAVVINSTRLNKSNPVKASDIYATGIMRLIQRDVIKAFSSQEQIDIKDQVLQDYQENEVSIQSVSKLFNSVFPYKSEINEHFIDRLTIEEILLLEVSQENPALMKNLPDLFSAKMLKNDPLYNQACSCMMDTIKQAPGFGEKSEDLFAFLCKPAKLSPNDLSGQLMFMLDNWESFIGTFKNALLRALDFIQEENRPVFPPGPGPSHTADFSGMDEEYEAFSSDSDWMPNVVMMAKSTLVWLDQLTKEYGYDITRLDQIPEREIDLLAERGFTALWLIGLWERSEASKRIKNACGNPEAEASAYSLHGYDIADSLGGWDALQNLSDKCKRRGIRLASDMVPNHTGLDSEWMINNPELFLQTDHPPFPAYSFDGPNLSQDDRIGIYLEDHYYSQTDAAVTFKRVDQNSGRVSHIYHGNDGTGMPWNDTAQLDYLNPATRETVIQTIIHVAKNFPIIRFDAAMTLAKKHIQRLWYPLPGSGGDIPSRSAYGMNQEDFNQEIPIEFWREVVDRIAEEVPDTLLLAEAFWMMEGYFVRTLGMHRVYNSAFMNMLKNEDNRKYRDTIKNTISFDPEILKRYVNFMNNPDEDTAINQFGDGDKYFGVCTLLITMPGLPMVGHGQVEGYREKYGMEFSKAYWDEKPNQYLVGEHYKRIFPLMKKRYLFSNAENFCLYDVIHDNQIQENIFAYTNQAGDERALVFYNNAFEKASGWINQSAPSLKRFGDDDRRLVSTDLGEALGLRGNIHDFFICTGFHDGLTYVRSSQEVCKRGVYVELDGYQTQIFIDFYEVEDKEGLYARLYEQLNGSGITDLEKELKRIKYSEVHFAAAPFYRMSTIDLMKNYCLRGEENDLVGLSKVLKDSLSLVHTIWDRIPFSSYELLPKRLDRTYEGLEKNLTALKQLISSVTSNKYLDNGLKIMPEIPTIFTIWLLIDQISSQYQSSKAIPDIGHEILLEDHIREALREYSVPSGEARRLIYIPYILTHYAGWYTTRGDSSQTELLRDLLNDPHIRAFCQINWHQDVEWFHKESLQECFFWLYTAEILQDPEMIEDEEFYMIIQGWLRKEMLAEYKVSRLF